MSAPSSYGAGLGATSRAMSNSRGRLVGVGNLESLPLLTVGMPNLSFWMRQTAPVIVGQGASVFLEFSVRPLTLGPSLDASDEWLPLQTAPIVLDPGGTVSLVNLFFPAAKIRLRTFQGFAVTFDYVLGCSA